SSQARLSSYTDSTKPGPNVRWTSTAARTMSRARSSVRFEGSQILAFLAFLASWRFISFSRPSLRSSCELLRCGAIAALGVAAGAACGGRSASEPAPTAALASSRGAQEAFRPLKQRFASADGPGRAALEPNLKWFVATYPKDGLE